MNSVRKEKRVFDAFQRYFSHLIRFLFKNRIIIASNFHRNYKTSKIKINCYTVSNANIPFIGGRKQGSERRVERLTEKKSQICYKCLSIKLFIFFIWPLPTSPLPHLFLHTLPPSPHLVFTRTFIPMIELPLLSLGLPPTPKK